MTDPRPPRIPGYLLHKATGQARVRISGTDHYLGPYGSEESRRRYGELIAQHAAGLIVDPYDAGDEDTGLTINEMTLAYLRWAQTYYVKGGKITAEYNCIKSGVKLLIDLYGSTPVADFGAMKLKVVRQAMVDSKTMCRRFVNQSVGRIRRLFKWGVENEMVDVTVLQKLQAVAPLLAGRTEAKDYAPRHAVPQADIDAVRAEVSEKVRDIMDIMLNTGARVGEIAMLTNGMIDRSGDTWTARFDVHKMIHKGKTRTIEFGPKSQLILRKYLSDDPTAKVFDIGKHAPSLAIKRACAKLGITKFTSHWLRHTSATRIRKDFGLEAAQVFLGHARADVSQLYAETNKDVALKIARDAG